MDVTDCIVSVPAVTAEFGNPQRSHLAWSANYEATEKLPAASPPTPVSGDSYPGIHLLQLFDALYRTRNVSRAAETLGICQPKAST